jgi:hypothetical protein
VNVLLRLAEANNWAYQGESSPDPVEGVTKILTWKVDDQVYFNYFEDVISKEPFVVIFSPGTVPTNVEEQVRHALDAWSVEDLASAIDQTNETEDRVKAVLRAGLGTPREFHADLFRKIENALHDANSKVRQAGLWATTYELWNEYYELLDEMVRLDPESSLREHASELRESFEIQKGINPW